MTFTLYMSHEKYTLHNEKQKRKTKTADSCRSSHLLMLQLSPIPITTGIPQTLTPSPRYSHGVCPHSHSTTATISPITAINTVATVLLPPSPSPRQSLQQMPSACHGLCLRTLMITGQAVFFLEHGPTDTQTEMQTKDLPMPVAITRSDNT